MDACFGRDPEQVVRTNVFDLPLRRDRHGDYKLAPGTEVFTCLTSDFFLEEADPWRAEAWALMRARPDVQFSIITKRIIRVEGCLPADWGDGYPNVAVGATVENQRQVDIRMPHLLAAPLQRRFVICEPLIGPVNLTPWLPGGLAYVMVGEESGSDARVCDYGWVLDLWRECLPAGVPFVFKQTGARLRKDGRVFKIARHLQRAQARKAGIDTATGILAE